MDRMNRSRAIRTFVAALALGLLPSLAGAHCACPHRHYMGRVYYIAPEKCHRPSWCDPCGNVWTRARSGKARRVDNVCEHRDGDSETGK